MHPVLINPGLRKTQEIQQEVQDAGEKAIRTHSWADFANSSASCLTTTDYFKVIA